jgi:hypothetical protein
MVRPIRLLKVDSCHPLSYLSHEQVRCREKLEGLSYDEYYRWLMGRRFGLSDFLTHYMNEAGWEARELIGNDDLLLRKLIESGQLPDSGLASRLRAFKQLIASTPLRDMVRPGFRRRFDRRVREELLDGYIRAYRPDVVFVREPCHIDGKFFSRFRNKCVLASFIGCNTNHPVNWDPFRNDIIFALTDEYFDFFRVQGIRTEHFSYGVDERIAREVGNLPKVYDCSFVGNLGQPHQRAKSQLLERVAQTFEFKWWGGRGAEMPNFPALQKAWQGETAGIDMYKIYRQSKIVLNDFVEMNAGQNVNMRSKEVFSVGTFLLTRRALNTTSLEEQQAIATFRNTDECLAKIRHYLQHEQERETIATQGLAVGLRDFNYRDISRRVMEALEKVVESKRQDGQWASS